ncbi:hypothetical protein AMTR_s00015p00239190 [Amborella trichopoda]|uniref:Secreted protein n=1 Tax=Amborella trichopoda TaxID=13333 RepID=W1PLK3_AMBTC|nr:hypothetical protein AMTR_s00015p00239190 [Amborella trichopoda]
MGYCHMRWGKWPILLMELLMGLAVGEVAQAPHGVADGFEGGDGGGLMDDKMGEIDGSVGHFGFALDVVEAGVGGQHSQVRDADEENDGGVLRFGCCGGG